MFTLNGKSNAGALIIFAIAFGVVVGLVFSLPVMWLWNGCLVPAISGVRAGFQLCGAVGEVPIEPRAWFRYGRPRWFRYVRPQHDAHNLCCGFGTAVRRALGTCDENR